MTVLASTPRGIFEVNDWANVNASGTASGVAGPLVLSRVVINGGTLGSLTIRDGLDASGGNVLATIAAPSAGNVFWYDAFCNNGISIFASAATDLTYVYKKI